MMLATSRSLGDRSFKESWEGVAAADAMERALDVQLTAATASSAGATPNEDRGDAALEAVDGASEAASDMAIAEAAAAAEVARTARARAKEAAMAGDSSGAAALAQAVTEAECAEKAAAEAAAEAAKRCLRPTMPPLLSPIPTVSSRPLARADRFVILACDGVWDVLTDQQVCQCSLCGSL